MTPADTGRCLETVTARPTSAEDNGEDFLSGGQAIHGEQRRFCWRAPWLAGLLLAAGLSAGAPAAATTAAATAAATALEPPEPIRVLLVGDSVTQGSSGDWTWRFRLWEHLSATSDRPVEFVGPRDDLHDYLVDQNGNHDYVDDGFDKDHAARWGMTLAFADTPIDDLVEAHQPDVVVEMLGTNDLLFLQNTPAQVEQNIENFVAAARSADAEVDVVLSEVTQTWFPGAPELNGLLAEGAADLDTVASRVVLADTDAGYTSSAHTFDDSHPNAQGEVLIAAAVADSLAGLGIGTAPARPLPAVPLGPRIPSTLSGVVSGGAVSLSWLRSPGAGTAQVSMRDVTAAQDWRVVSDSVSGTGWTSSSVPRGHRLQFRVLPRKGWQLAQPEMASNVVALRVPPTPGRPVPKVEPSRIRVGKAVLRWPAVVEATSYRVQLRRVGRARWHDVAADRARPRLVLRGLRSATTYVVRVSGANGTGVGPWSAGVRFRIPRGT